MSHLHQLFASILAIHGMPQGGDTSPVRRAAYVSDLLKMDWHFEQCDDHTKWRASRKELTRLREEQRDIDPDGSAGALPGG